MFLPQGFQSVWVQWVLYASPSTMGCGGVWSASLRQSRCIGQQLARHVSKEKTIAAREEEREKRNGMEEDGHGSGVEEERQGSGEEEEREGSGEDEDSIGSNEVVNAEGSGLEADRQKEHCRGRI